MILWLANLAVKLACLGFHTAPIWSQRVKKRPAPLSDLF